jgi:hypothetical protein
MLSLDRLVFFVLLGCPLSSVHSNVLLLEGLVLNKAKQLK